MNAFNRNLFYGLAINGLVNYNEENVGAVSVRDLLVGQLWHGQPAENLWDDLPLREVRMPIGRRFDRDVRAGLFPRPIVPATERPRGLQEYIIG